MHATLIVNGPPRSGKTTLVERIIAEFGPAAHGFVTREIKREGQRVGFQIVLHDGTSAILASTSAFSTGPAVGKYRVNLKGIEETVLRFFQDPGVAPLYYVDEIGKMEMAHPQFGPLFEAFARDTPGFLVVTVGLAYLPWATRTCPRNEVLTLSRASRARAIEKARRWLSDKIIV
ncbi:MAG: nucleoside-triphosphatase [bacterium JZ-2024 1]